MMNKSELIEAIHDELPNPAVLTKADITRVLDALATVATRHLAGADADAEAEVALPGLGKLRSKNRAARTGRNPKTGEVVEIPERRTVTFKAGKALAEAVQ
jgi:nucleoid DNA-binding protein